LSRRTLALDDLIDIRKPSHEFFARSAYLGPSGPLVRLKLPVFAAVEDANDHHFALLDPILNDIRAATERND
jgi:hypothetical protein